MPTRKPKFGDELRKLREEKGLTIDQVAKAAKVDRSTIWAAEKGTRSIRGSTRHKLFEALTKSNNNTMQHTDIKRAILAVERLALAAERIADMLEKPTKK